MRFLYLTFAAVLALTAACSDPDVKVEIAALPRNLTAVAVTPLTIHYADDSFESTRRSQDVLDTLWRQSNWRVLTPNDFSFRDADAVDLLQGTDLVLRARDLGVDPRQLALLRGSIALNVASGQATVAGDEGIAVGRDYAATTVVRVALVAMDGKTIIETEHTRVVDPFAERPDYDDRPEIRQAVVTAVQALIETCAACFVGVERPAVALYSNPVRLLDAPLPSGSTWRQQINAAGEIERDQLLWRAMQYAHPTLDLPDALRLAGTPPGACAAGEPEPPLRTGDCIIAVDNVAVDGVHALSRALEPVGSHILTVAGQSGSSRIISWPAP